jgi:heterodisulfide reductase subunit A-like polyferredoxin
MDIFNVLADVRREKIFDYVCLHPQLCVGDGEEFLKVLLAGKDTERLYIAACDPQMQAKMFRDALDAAGFERSRLVSIDIRNKTTGEAVEAIKGMVAQAA